MNRRYFLKALGLISTSALAAIACAKEAIVSGKFSKAEWQKLLPPESYRVLFEENTERSGTSPLNHEKGQGVFVCAACYNPLFDSANKYDSGTGWPSFSKPREGGVAIKSDFQLILPRTEYHCAHCGGHQGHLFDDGPQPTGKRYCNNGVALRFVAQGETLPAIRG